jgi:lipopolysaccharide/colanic/teichoic acid biosynthesis glycosyltransferase
MITKRIFDILFSLLFIILLSPFFLIISILILVTSGFPVIFKQVRICQRGEKFIIYKFRTMRSNDQLSTISVTGDSRITTIGKYLRKSKLDELPELFNILKGDMSFVGPRPDVSGYYDRLKGKDRDILKLKPGLTGPASLKYINEEEILAQVEDPKWYNDNIIFPDKVRINKLYLENWSLLFDLRIIFHTLIRKKYNEKNYFKDES